MLNRNAMISNCYSWCSCDITNVLGRNVIDSLNEMLKMMLDCLATDVKWNAKGEVKCKR
jgi:hypothetical protein